MIAINRNNFKFVLYTNTLGTHYAMYLQLINEYYILPRILLGRFDRTRNYAYVICIFANYVCVVETIIRDKHNNITTNT